MLNLFIKKKILHAKCDFSMTMVILALSWNVYKTQKKQPPCLNLPRTKPSNHCLIESSCSSPGEGGDPIAHCLINTSDKDVGCFVHYFPMPPPISLSLHIVCIESWNIHISTETVVFLAFLELPVSAQYCSSLWTTFILAIPTFKLSIFGLCLSTYFHIF